MDMHEHETARPDPAEDPVFATLVARTRGLQPWRRVFHAANGIVLALAPGWLGLERSATLWILGAVTALLFAGDLARLRFASFNRLFFTGFRHLASPREAGKLASSSWYALAAFLAWLVFPENVAVASILVLALADPAASVVGRLWGSRALGKGSREGAAAFVVTAALVLLPFAPPGPALVAALVTGAAEVLPSGLDDNLFVPLTCGAVLWLMTGAVG